MSIYSPTACRIIRQRIRYCVKIPQNNNVIVMSFAAVRFDALTAKTLSYIPVGLRLYTAI